MADVTHEIEGELAWIRLDDGRANAMNAGWLDQLGEALDRVEESPARVVVLCGRDGFFSGGLDLKTLPDLDAAALRATTNQFMRAMRRCFLFPKPIIAAANGHCIAGGMMLYLAADLRIAVDRADIRFVLNEATNGIPLVGGTAGLCLYSIPPEHHTELVLLGREIDVAGTVDRGITHELVSDATSLATRARVRARELLNVDPAAYRINKQLLREAAWDDAARAAERFRDAAPGAEIFDRLRR